MEDDIPFEKVSPSEAKAATSLELDTPKPAEKSRSNYRDTTEQTRPDIKELMPWVQQLPAEVRPRHLIVQYPRIANKMAKLWKYPIACEKYLNELMLDERGDRQGFPPEVGQEITALQIYFNTTVLKPQYTVWGDRIGD